MEISLRLFRLFVIAAALAALPAFADQVTILTGFPKELTEIYAKAFEAKYPDTKVEIISKSTTTSVAYLKTTAAGQRPDVFWASAPDAFSVLAKEQLLLKLPLSRDLEIPEKVGEYPINDAEGYYRGQALAGYGIMWNTNYVKAKKLAPPKEWTDLAKSAYYGHVAMSSPAKSGTTHLTVETLLQGEGWETGWRQLLMIAGNCAAITEKSTDVPEGVVAGKYGAGLVIDFFGHSAKYTGAPVDFTYPRVTAIVPASIALVAGSKNSEAGRKFLQFSLSREGQSLLLDPKISRLPILMGVYSTTNVPRDFPNVYRIARSLKVKFDPETSQARYGVVSGLFDAGITNSLADLQQVTRAIHDAERKLNKSKSREGRALLEQARQVAYTPLVSAADLTSADLLEQYKKQKDPEVAKQIAANEAKWSAKAKENYAKAIALAQNAGASR